MSEVLRVRNAETEDKRMLTHRHRNSTRSQYQVTLGVRGRGLCAEYHFYWEKGWRWPGEVARRREARAELAEKAWGMGWGGSPFQLGPVQSVPGEVLPIHGNDWLQTARALVRTQKPRSHAWLGGWLRWMAPLWHGDLWPQPS